MLQQERHNQILAKLDLEGQVRVRDLSKDFNVTEDCIRKDLTILEKNGKLKRIHGGATQLRTNLHTC
ncbi:MAG: DeoR family transcriptional regulator [Thomasclavelia sp.]